MLRQQYPEVFEALNTTRTPNNSDCHDEQLAPFFVDIQEGQQTESNQGKESQEGESQDETRDIDLMASDYEDDEEEIESENEQDRAFLDDETEEQEDVSFYRRFHVELARDRRQDKERSDENWQYMKTCCLDKHRPVSTKSLFNRKRN